jgi:hypothetical protein
LTSNLQHPAFASSLADVLLRQCAAAARRMRSLDKSG